MQAATSKLDARMRKAVSKTFTNLCTKIIDDTPVGDKSLWTSAKKAVAAGKVESIQDYKPNYVPGTLVNSWFSGVGGDIPAGLSPREPNTSGATSLAQVRLIADEAAGKVAWFANPTPYANMIEFGAHSTQAPAGMVRINTNIFKDIFRIALNGS
jgi:hypothetical protein